MGHVLTWNPFSCRANSVLVQPEQKDVESILHDNAKSGPRTESIVQLGRPTAPQENSLLPHQIILCEHVSLGMSHTHTHTHTLNRDLPKSQWKRTAQWFL